jgi:amidohydrolase
MNLPGALALVILLSGSGLQSTPGVLPASPLAKDIDRLAAAVEPELLEWRRYLHQHPELSNREVETAKYVAERLRGFGLEPQTGVARHGVVALL